MATEADVPVAVCEPIGDQVGNIVENAIKISLSTLPPQKQIQDEKHNELPAVEGDTFFKSPSIVEVHCDQQSDETEQNGTKDPLVEKIEVTKEIIHEGSLPGDETEPRIPCTSQELSSDLINKVAPEHETRVVDDPNAAADEASQENCTSKEYVDIKDGAEALDEDVHVSELIQEKSIQTSAEEQSRDLMAKESTIKAESNSTVDVSTVNESTDQTTKDVADALLLGPESATNEQNDEESNTGEKGLHAEQCSEESSVVTDDPDMAITQLSKDTNSDHHEPETSVEETITTVEACNVDELQGTQKDAATDHSNTNLADGKIIDDEVLENLSSSEAHRESSKFTVDVSNGTDQPLESAAGEGEADKNMEGLEHEAIIEDEFNTAAEEVSHESSTSTTVELETSNNKSGLSSSICNEEETGVHEAENKAESLHETVEEPNLGQENDVEALPEEQSSDAAVQQVTSEHADEKTIDETDKHEEQVKVQEDKHEQQIKNEAAIVPDEKIEHVQIESPTESSHAGLDSIEVSNSIKEKELLPDEQSSNAVLHDEGSVDEKIIDEVDKHEEKIENLEGDEGSSMIKMDVSEIENLRDGEAKKAELCGDERGTESVVLKTQSTTEEKEETLESVATETTRAHVEAMESENIEELENRGEDSIKLEVEDGESAAATYVDSLQVASEDLKQDDLSPDIINSVEEQIPSADCPEISSDESTRIKEEESVEPLQVESPREIEGIEIANSSMKTGEGCLLKDEESVEESVKGEDEDYKETKMSEQEQVKEEVDTEESPAESLHVALETVEESNLSQQDNIRVTSEEATSEHENMSTTVSTEGDSLIKSENEKEDESPLPVPLAREISSHVSSSLHEAQSQDREAKEDESKTEENEETETNVVNTIKETQELETVATETTREHVETTSDSQVERAEMEQEEEHLERSSLTKAPEESHAKEPEGIDELKNTGNDSLIKEEESLESLQEAAHETEGNANDNKEEISLKDEDVVISVPVEVADSKKIEDEEPSTTHEAEFANEEAAKASLFEDEEKTECALLEEQVHTEALKVTDEEDIKDAKTLDLTDPKEEIAEDESCAPSLHEDTIEDSVTQVDDGSESQEEQKQVQELIVQDSPVESADDSGINEEKVAPHVPAEDITETTECSKESEAVEDIPKDINVPAEEVVSQTPLKEGSLIKEEESVEPLQVAARDIEGIVEGDEEEIVDNVTALEAESPKEKDVDSEDKSPIKEDDSQIPSSEQVPAEKIDDDDAKLANKDVEKIGCALVEEEVHNEPLQVADEGIKDAKSPIEGATQQVSELIVQDSFVESVDDSGTSEEKVTLHVPETTECSKESDAEDIGKDCGKEDNAPIQEVVSHTPLNDGSLIKEEGSVEPLDVAARDIEEIVDDKKEEIDDNATGLEAESPEDKDVVTSLPVETDDSRKIDDDIFEPSTTHEAKVTNEEAVKASLFEEGETECTLVEEQVHVEALKVADEEDIKELNVTGPKEETAEDKSYATSLQEVDGSESQEAEKQVSELVVPDSSMESVDDSGINEETVAQHVPETTQCSKEIDVVEDIPKDISDCDRENNIQSEEVGSQVPMTEGLLIKEEEVVEPKQVAACDIEGIVDGDKEEIAQTATALEAESPKDKDDVDSEDKSPIEVDDSQKPSPEQVPAEKIDDEGVVKTNLLEDEDKVECALAEKEVHIEPLQVADKDTKDDCSVQELAKDSHEAMGDDIDAKAIDLTTELKEETLDDKKHATTPLEETNEDSLPEQKEVSEMDSGRASLTDDIKEATLVREVAAEDISSGQVTEEIADAAEEETREAQAIAHQDDSTREQNTEEPCLRETMEITSQEERSLSETPGVVINDNKENETIQETPEVEVLEETESVEVETPTKKEESSITEVPEEHALTSNEHASDITTVESEVPEQKNEQVIVEANICGDKTDSEEIQPRSEKEAEVTKEEAENDQKNITETLPNHASEDISESKEVNVEEDYKEISSSPVFLASEEVATSTVALDEDSTCNSSHELIREVAESEEAETQEPTLKASKLIQGSSVEKTEVEEDAVSCVASADVSGITEEKVAPHVSAKDIIETTDCKESDVVEGAADAECIDSQVQNDETKGFLDETEPTVTERELTNKEEPLHEERSDKGNDDEKEACEEKMLINENTSVEGISVDTNSVTVLETKSNDEAPEIKETATSPAEAQEEIACEKEIMKDDISSEKEQPPSINEEGEDIKEYQQGSCEDKVPKFYEEADDKAQEDVKEAVTTEAIERILHEEEHVTSIEDPPTEIDDEKSHKLDVACVESDTQDSNKEIANIPGGESEEQTKKEEICSLDEVQAKDKESLMLPGGKSDEEVKESYEAVERKLDFESQAKDIPECEVSSTSDVIALTKQSAEDTIVTAKVQGVVMPEATGIESGEVEEFNDNCAQMEDASMPVQTPVISMPTTITLENAEDSEVKNAVIGDATTRDIDGDVKELCEESFEKSNNDNQVEVFPSETVKTSEGHEEENATPLEKEEGSMQSSIFSQHDQNSDIKTSDKHVVLEANDNKNSDHEQQELSQGEHETEKPPKVEQEEDECRNEEGTKQKVVGNPESEETNKASLSDLIRASTTETSSPIEKEPTSHAKDLRVEDKDEEAEHENSKTDEEKDGDEESHEAPVMVDMGDAEVKVTPKKSHNILSGVGSKVKHSIAKVKKAITGKPSTPKPPSPKKVVN